MELIKDIYFNTDKLIENTKVKVSYTGKFYQENNEKVFLHYGYGENWNNTNEIEMKKTNLGYQTEINLLSSPTLNFCFKNQNNEWDNNCGKNYIFEIQKSNSNNLKKVGVDDSKEKNSFLGKTFGKSNEKTPNENIFWNSLKAENQNEFSVQKNQTSGVTENTIPVGIPISVDTFINKNQKCNNINLNTSEKIESACKVGNEFQPNVKLNEIPVSNNGSAGTFNVPITNNNKTNSNINNINEFNKNNINNIGINAKIATPNGISGVNGNQCGNNNINSNNTPKFAPVNNVAQQNTSLAVINTGFQKTIIWTKKIKTSVCKFFSYVPKLISGNYKRKVENKQQK